MNDHSAVAKAGSKPTILTLERLTECNTAALSSGCVDRVHVALQLADLGFTCLDVCVVHHAANLQAKPKHAVHVMAGGSVLYGHYRRQVGTRSVKFGFQLAAGLARVYAGRNQHGLDVGWASSAARQNADGYKRT
ncbi:hypothetical protein NKJ74_25630 [Mesorhizobium sp. M0046]|uniref:hypothetical protein n=1 Tax=Mesorhizobium sp. M0046 TaxID=2956858 RepID=UPI00333BE782